MSYQKDQDGHLPRLEVVIQKLEESLTPSDGSTGERSLTLQGDGQESGATPQPISTHICQIITRNLSEKSTGESSEVSELEESRALREHPSHSDQPLIKHTSLTEKLDQMLMLSSAADSDLDSSPLGSMQLQNKEKAYRQKLQVFQEAQRRQAQLVQKLQTKVLQYKNKCGELQEQIQNKTLESEKMRLMLQANVDSVERQKRVEQELNIAIQKKFAQLQEEQRRCASLSQVNSVLREQLDQADTVNKGLTESLWKAHEDFELCDKRLRREQETCAFRSSREQARVRALWRQAASLRSIFTQLRAFTDRILSDMRGECVTVSQQLHVACVSVMARVTDESTSNGVDMSILEMQLRGKMKEALQLQIHWDAEKVEFNSRILELTNTLKHIQSQSNDKDASLNSMQISLDRMESRRTEDKVEMEALRGEIQAYQKILYHIHQLVCRDGEGTETFSSHLYEHSPLKNATLNAVQNALFSHEKQSQDLHSHLEAALVQVDIFRDRLQANHLEKIKMEQTVQEVQRERQKTEKALEESLKESNNYLSSLELMSSEKQSLEKLLLGLHQEVDSQRVELEVLRSSSQDLQRNQDLLRQQREDLEMQLACQCTKAQRGDRSLQELEVKHSNLNKELIMMKEVLSQITLQKELLENEKASLTMALNKLESHSATQECALAKLQNQEAALKDSLAKMAALNEGLAKDKVDLNRIIMQSESQKAELDERRREAELQRAAAREESVRVLKDVMNLTADKQALESSNIQLQDICQKLEAEMNLMQKEKAWSLERHSQVESQMQTLTEELFVSRMELEAKTTAVETAARDREELVKDKAALDVKLNSTDRKACGLSQELVLLRAEKISLERALFESQEHSASLEVELARLEDDRHKLMLANMALTRDAQMHMATEQQLSKAAQHLGELEKKLAQAERNAQLMLKKNEQNHREQLEAERQQKEQQHAEVMVQQQQAQEQLRKQCEELSVHSQKELQQVQEELTGLQREFSQRLLMAESEKQQALSQKEAEKAIIIEKMQSLQHDVATADMEIERMQRMALSKQGQDENAIAVLKSELQNMQTQFEESLITHRNANDSLMEQVRELNQQNEQAKQELEGFRKHLKDAEDGFIKGQRDLIEAHRQLQSCAHERDELRKEALDLKQLVGDKTREKEAIQGSNLELRAFVKKAESDNSSLRRALEEKKQRVSILEECKVSMQQEKTSLSSSLRELEKSYLRARRELQELRRQVKVLEGENNRQKQELGELQARGCQEEQKEEEARLEAFTLRQRLLECEACREAALNEVACLQCRVKEMETAKQQSQVLLQEKVSYQHQSNQMHEEATAKLEADLENSKIQVKDLTVQIGVANNKAQNLEEQLDLSDAKCRHLEHHLARLYTALHQTFGINHTRLFDKPGPQRRSLSPLKRCSEVKGRDSVTELSMLTLRHGEDEEWNVDAVSTAIQKFVQEFRNAQRDRDEAKAQIVSLSQHVSTLKDSQDKLGMQLLQVNKSLKQSEDGKQKLAEQLKEAQTSHSILQDVINRTDMEKRSLEKELVQLRTSLHSSQTESITLQNKLDILQRLESCANLEKLKLKESLEEAESKANRIELYQCTLEGELQRTQLRAAELEVEAGALQERLKDMRRKLSKSENQCAVLRVSEERLATSLARAERHESQLREQNQKLSSTVCNNVTNAEGLQEQLTQLQTALTASEQDRRLLQEHLDKTRDALSEKKRQNHTLTAQSQNFQRAQEDLELKLSELEKHNRTLRESLKQQQEAELQTSQQLQRDKEELQEKLCDLQSSLRKLQNERGALEKVLARIGKDKSALRKTLEKVEMERLRKEEEAAFAARERTLLEQRVCSLEQELAAKQEMLETMQVQSSRIRGQNSRGHVN
ncbi:uncharacterized protein crocc2 [Menidia menidia]